MIKKITFTAITDETIKTIKADLKAKGVQVGIRKNKQRYAAGGININPMKKNGYRFTSEECEIIAKHLLAINIDSMHGSMNKRIDNPERLKHIYYGGFQFMAQRTV